MRISSRTVSPMNEKTLNRKKTCDALAGRVYNFPHKLMHAQKRVLPDLELRLRHDRFQLKGDSRSRHHSPGSQQNGKTFNAGQPVIETGIYEVLHDRSHRTAHEVVMLNGDAFPPCDTCAERVRFRLVRTAPYIFQDEDFENQE
jgi:hypothetical protein